MIPRSPISPRFASALIAVVVFVFTVPLDHAQSKEAQISGPVVDALKSCDTKTRQEAIESVSNLNGDVEAVIPLLGEIVRSDPRSSLRLKALKAISRLGLANELQNQRNTIVRILKDTSEADPDQEVRSAASIELVQAYGISSAESYKKLQSLLTMALNTQKAECQAREDIKYAGDNISLKIQELTKSEEKSTTDWSPTDTEVLNIAREMIPALRQSMSCDVADMRIDAAISVAKASHQIVPSLNQLYEKALHVAEREYYKVQVEDAKQQQFKAISDTTVLLIKALDSAHERPQPEIVNGLVESARAGALLKREDLLESLNNSSEAVAKHGFEREANDIRLSVKSISDASQRGLINSFNQLPWWKRTVIYGTALLAFLFISSFFLIPVALVRTSEKITSNNPLSFRLPDKFGGPTISLHPQDFLLLRLQYSYRALRAWVGDNLEKAQKNLAKNPTVEESAVYVPTEIVFDGVRLPSLQPAHLHALFRKNQCRMVISGDGGTGKTTLAVQIAHWAMAHGMMHRVCEKHPMIPILLQRNESDVLKAIRVQLTGMTDSAELLSEKLVRVLLKRKFLLVVLDGFSELSSTTQDSVIDAINELSINALIMTSRKRELKDQPRSVIQIKQLQASNTVAFISHYVKLSGKEDLFDEQDFKNAELKLRAITDNRGVPALLAKLYVDQMIAIKETPGGVLPDNIPDLIESNIVTIHHKREFKTDIILGKLETIAWECLRDTFTPIHASREAVLNALGNEPSTSDLLTYLEDELKILRVDGDLICFALDPVAEYLAALHVIRHNKNSLQAWRGLLTRIRRTAKPAPETTAIRLSPIKGFLFALRDCCLTKGRNYLVPENIIAEIDELAKRSDEADSPERSA